VLFKIDFVIAVDQNFQNLIVLQQNLKRAEVISIVRHFVDFLHSQSMSLLSGT
jgi:hypothetical protein